MTTNSLIFFPSKRRSLTCNPMFTTALFTIARTWKQPRCPSTEEWIKKMWYIHTLGNYLTIKKNKTVPLAEMWIDSETIIQNEISQKEKNKYISTHICGI